MAEVENHDPQELENLTAEIGTIMRDLKDVIEEFKELGLVRPEVSEDYSE